ncbi:Putative flavin monooxygenase, FAD/NAD(P)-binding domain superfamily [Septoria linicola]|uniref:Flavin monooxygenase, FAD/NAD(P)-binding domain superfamily n=1 Tax=Septoria linicola TaxID=215465 RepID=A0A9Q9B3L5_9PEZI|nr:Putative flavin monooxygenase, FAD/NAD(P)-binding domain superfamily [Septoria linicola]
MSTNTIEKDVIVIGGGFGGCYLLKLLREKGFSTTLIEAADRLGGVWAWSQYPGARVDCELPWYGFSDPAIWSTWMWTERYPSYIELRSYFDHVANVWDLHKDVLLNTRVVETKWQEDEQVWLTKTEDGQKYRSRWVIAATGTSFKQHIPEFPGKDKFRGEVHHSAVWPDSLPLNGKKVAVIGAGSSGLQVVQESAKVCTELTQFIRTPNLAVPMRQRKITPEEILAHKCQFEHVFKACRTTRSGLPVVGTGRRTFDDSPEERKRLLEEQWTRGGFNWSVGCYADTLIDKDANLEFYKFWRSKQLLRMKNKQKADILIPEEPPYYISTKRPSLEQDYYEMADRDNVTITNSPIVEFTERGIKTEDGIEHEFDIVAICTGYDAVTGGLRTMGIKGRDGIDLDEKWKDGIVTNLGMTVNGFPNFMMVYGPQAPTSLTNGPPFIELQCEWILDLFLKQRGEKLATVEPSKSAEQAWREHTLDLANKTLAVETDSWYMGANVPGKKREYLLYAGGIPMWHEHCQAALEGWRDFETSRARAQM